MRTHLKVGEICVAPSCAIREAAARMDRHHLGIVLVVNRRRQLLGTVNDGDLRRALLARIDLQEPVQVLLDRKIGSPFAKPLAAPLDAGPEAARALFEKYGVMHVPLLDKRGRVAGLAARDDFPLGQPLPLQAVVMAGGKGSRLMPLTKDTPKPMLRVGDKPLMELILEQLRDVGIKHVQVSTHHKREKIEGHFRDGSQIGLDLSYIYEEKPLGTAGALGLLQRPKDTLLVMNGDVLTQIDFRAMLKYHREMKADLTAAVCQYDFKVPYGVVDCSGVNIRRVKEKPTLEFFVCAGIYMLEPCALRHIPKGRSFDMTALIGRLASRGRKVVSFPVREYWLDIGKPEDYAAAQKHMAGLQKEKAAA